VGAEGAFSPDGFNNIKVLEYLKGHFPERKLALDAAGTFAGENPDWQSLTQNYNLCSVEDPCSDDDWEGWKAFYDTFSEKILVVGDDLTVTNPERLKKALDPKVINAIIIKPNQNGTISGTLKTISAAKENGLRIIISHRGEETNDDWIADLAVEAGADYVKFGGISRGERIAKYNRLRELGML
jgi:enolase